MDDIDFKREYDTTIWAQDIDSDIQKTTSGIWTKDNPFIIDVGHQKIKFDYKSWLELKKGVIQLRKQTEDSVKIVCKKENKNDKGENENMENKEFNEIKELAKSIICKVKNSKLNQVLARRNVEITEFEKRTEIQKLVDKHANTLKEEINHLMGRENNKIDIEASFNIYGYLTNEENVERGKIIEKASNDYSKTKNQLDNIVNSLELCTTVDQVNNFLEKQGFVKDGLIVEPKKWKGNEDQ